MCGICTSGWKKKLPTCKYYYEGVYGYNSAKVASIVLVSVKTVSFNKRYSMCMLSFKVVLGQVHCNNSPLQT